MEEEHCPVSGPPSERLTQREGFVHLQTPLKVLTGTSSSSATHKECCKQGQSEWSIDSLGGLCSHGMRHEKLDASCLTQCTANEEAASALMQMLYPGATAISSPWADPRWISALVGLDGLRGFFQPK